MKVHELLENEKNFVLNKKNTALLASVKLLSKDEFLLQILRLIRKEDVVAAKNMLWAAEKLKLTYPELPAIMKSIGAGERIPTSAQQLPTYDAQLRHNKGSVIDWMQDNNITDTDLRTARRRVVELSAFKELQKIAVYSPTPKREKNGTLNFKVGEQEFQVHANGQVRTLSSGLHYSNSPVKIASPAPTVVANDPVETLLQTYAGGLATLTKYIKNRASRQK